MTTGTEESNMKQYRELENCYEGSPLIVMGNGPSLKDVPVTLLTKYPTMGCNSIYTNPHFTEFPVDWYVIEGLGHLKTDLERRARMPYVEQVGKNKGATLVNRRMVQYFQHLPEVYAIDYITSDGRKADNFMFDPFDVYGTGHCVTFCMLQFAYYLTEGPILLVGLDHKFIGDDWHFFKDEETPQFESMPIAEYARFRQRVDPKFTQVASVFDGTGRDIYNLTPDSAAEMFPLGEYEEWI